MIGGSVSGNIVNGNIGSNGAGVANVGASPIFTMHGGEISENSARDSAGGVFNEGEFIMTGGTIFKNVVNYDGAGVYNSDTFEMSGGTISLNESAGRYAGGVYNGGVFRMTGGRITYNFAYEYTGGVYNSSTSQMFLSGDIKITHNMKDGECRNIFLPDDKYIIITGALATSAAIGIYTNVEPTALANTKFAEAEDDPAYTITASDLNAFYDDHRDFSPILSTGSLEMEYRRQLAETITITDVAIPTIGVSASFEHEARVDGVKAIDLELCWFETDVPIASLEELFTQAGPSNMHDISQPFTFVDDKYYSVLFFINSHATTSGESEATLNGETTEIAAAGEIQSFIFYSFGEAVEAQEPPEPPTPPAPSHGGSGKSSQTITVPVTSENDKVQTTVTVKGSEATLEKPNDAKLEALLEDASKGGVEVDLSGLNKKIESVILPTDTVSEIAKAMSDNDEEDKALAIKLSSGTVVLDVAALSAIIDQAEGMEIRLVLDEAGVQGLNTSQRSTLENQDVHGVIDAYLVKVKTNERISDFKGGVATLRIPFTIPTGLDAKGFSVWYLDDNGKATKHDTWYEDKHLVWETGHFSDYVIVYDKAIAENPFVDVSTDNYFYDAVLWAASEKITEGTSTTTFSPTNGCTRAQIVTFLYRYFN